MKILITLDGSEFAETILKPITELAALSAAEVHIIEVVKPTRRKDESCEKMLLASTKVVL